MRNSTGKATMIRILAALLCPDGGAVRVLGRDVVCEAAAVRKLVSLGGRLRSLDLRLSFME